MPHAAIFQPSKLSGNANHSATVALAGISEFHSNLDSLPVDVTPPPISNLARSSISSSKARSAAKIVMPQPGDTFLGFRLVEELGHGTFARVFLAKQEALAGREVALKVTLRPTREPERIARLQHTNVVPVYSVHEAAPVQIICMPYLGRRTLADALVGYRKSQVAAPGHSTRKAVATRKGSSVAGSRSRSGFRLPVESAPKPAASESAASNAAPLVGNVDAVLSIASQLASGLAHAHERGVLHLDLKPANVLLADTGEPMLLDFNLSHAEFEANREIVGGTVPYMAPEQLLDLKTRGEGNVDARTDLYSLGVLSFELLTGKHPFPVASRTLAEFDGLIADRGKGAPSLRDINPDITPAVEAIVRKLLAPRPHDRYQSANDLHDDLERQLADRPLRFAADRSIPERIGKWRRRNPRALVAMLFAAVLALAGSTGAYALNESAKRATGEAESRARGLRDGLEAVRLDLALPGDPAVRTRGMKQAMVLLGEYGLPADPNWQAKPAFQRMPESQRAALAGDIGELLILLAQARWEEGKTDDRLGAAGDARKLNKLAENCFGDAPPPLLVRQRAELEGAIAGRPVDSPQSGKSRTARDYFLDGAELVGAAKHDAAIKHLELAIGREPNHAAGQFLLAYCRQQLGHFDRALERYQSAAVLMPADPRPDYYSGIVLGLQGRHEPAEEAFTNAIQKDARYGEAYRNRGIARIELMQYRDAESDLTAALENRAPRLQVLLLRAQAREKLEDENGAEEDRKAAASLTPEREADFMTIGYTRLAAEPKVALANFRLALEKNPRSFVALNNLTLIYTDVLIDEKAALETASKMVDLYPEFEPGRAMKALCLARLGDRAAAHREAEACRLLFNKQKVSLRDAKTVYRLACVYAITSRTEAKDAIQAFAYLKEACRYGFSDISLLERSADLAPIRDLPEFAPILNAVKDLS